MNDILERVLLTKDGKKHVIKRAWKYMWASGLGCDGKDVWTMLPDDIKGMIIRIASKKHKVTYVTWCLLHKGMMSVALRFYPFKTLNGKYFVNEMLIQRSYTDVRRDAGLGWITFESRIQSAGITFREYIQAACANSRITTWYHSKDNSPYGFIDALLLMFWIDHEMHPFHMKEGKMPKKLYQALHYAREQMSDAQYRTYLAMMYIENNRVRLLDEFTDEQIAFDMMEIRRVVDEGEKCDETARTTGHRVWKEFLLTNH